MIRLFKRFGKKETLLLILASLFLAVQIYFTLKIPDYMENITVLVKDENSSLDDILKNGGMMLVFAAGSLISGIIANGFSVRMSALFSMNLRRDLYNHIEEFSNSEIDKFSTASLITRNTNDVTQIQNFLYRGLQNFIKIPFMVVFALVKITGKHSEWTFLTSVAVMIMLTLVIFLMIYAHPKLRMRQTYTDNLSRILREELTGVRVIRAYNAEDLQKEKYSNANKILTVSERKAHHAMRLMMPTVRFINNALMAAIYISGAYIIAKADSGDRITIFSDMIVYSSYAVILLRSFMDLNMVFNQYPRASVSAERIFEVLDTSPKVKDGSGSINPEEKGKLEFRHVSFKYPGSKENVLDDVSFTLEDGKTLAIIGATGSGKSTIVNLIPRLYNLEQGEILLDDVNIKDIPLKELRNRLGYTGQKAILLTGTVKSNIAYGDNGKKEINDIEIKEALDTAQADFVYDIMPEGIESEITRGGTNVSGGQKQRLSIARSIARKPEIYLFDDTFSALDYKTDKALRKELKEKEKGISTLLVAQRIGTIRDADSIIVLDEGRIVGQGTHDYLMKNCKVYREIAETQLSKEELA